MIKCKTCNRFYMISWDDDDYFYDHHIQYCLGCCKAEKDCDCWDKTPL